MDPAKMAAAFNEWLRRYTEEPERYDAEFRYIGQFLEESAGGVTPSYGETCAAYLTELAAELP